MTTELQDEHVVNDPITAWVELGRANPWIRRAVDPPFCEHSFARVHSASELIEKFVHGNWALGVAFYIRDVRGHDYAFIQQVNGGDEYLVIRDDLVFESISAAHMIRDGSFIDWWACVTGASDEQLRDLTY